MFTGILKDTIKDTDEQPDEEIHRVRSGRVLSAGASVPVELGCVTLLVWMCLPTWKFSEPPSIGILRRLPHVGMVSYYYYFLINLFIYLFLAALGLHCCAQAFSSCGERGLLFVAVHGLLTAVASLVVEHGL